MQRFLPLTIGLLCAFLLLAAPILNAATVEELQAQINSSNKQIEQIRAEITQLQQKLTSTTAEKQTLQKAINELNLSIQKIQKNISLTQAELKKKDLEIGGLSDSITDTASKINHSQGGVGATLRELYSLDEEPMIMTLLAKGTLSSFFDEQASLESLRVNLQNQIHDLSNLKDNLETNKDEAETKRQELAALNNQLSEQRQGLDAAKGTQSKLLADTQSKESSYQALITQKKAEEAAFEAALFKLSSQLQFTLDPNSFPKAGTTVLRWPLDNVFITQQFGQTVDSVRLYASGTHDGIDLRADIGTPVHAALGGTVFEINQGAVPLCQYGKWVIIKHPNGLATLYAHLSSIKATKGQSVSAGDVIGFSGNTGYATGPHLHFTVYAANAISLKQYTCKSGYTVTIPIAAVNAYLNPLSYLPPL